MSRDRPGLRLLVVDDEQPVLAELQYLLARDPNVADVVACASATEALRTLRDGGVEGGIDACLLDVSMPGLSGLELAEVLAQFREPPPLAFVTAHETHAVAAFELRAVDYVLKPVREERLAEAVRRLAAAVAGGPDPAETAGPSAPGPSAPGSSAPGSSAPGSSAPGSSEKQIPVERGGVTRFLDRSEVTHVEAQGDYARLHTAHDSHLIRVPLSTLEQQWAAAGFVRIHRSLLVSLGHVTEVRTEAGRCSVRVGGAQSGAHGGDAGVELVVARRHTRELRDLLLRRAGRRPGA